MLKGNITGDNNRIISGDVLSGQQVGEDGFLGFNADQVTVVKEGDDYEIFGWLLPLAPRPSVSGTMPSYDGPETEFEANTGNIEKMEGLGITELTEEDVALCEFACTSKNPLQSILRDGLNNLKEQL